MAEVESVAYFQGRSPASVWREMKDNPSPSDAPPEDPFVNNSGPGPGRDANDADDLCEEEMKRIFEDAFDKDDPFAGMFNAGGAGSFRFRITPRAFTRQDRCQGDFSLTRPATASGSRRNAERRVREYRKDPAWRFSLAKSFEKLQARLGRELRSDRDSLRRDLDEIEDVIAFWEKPRRQRSR